MAQGRAGAGARRVWGAWGPVKGATPRAQLLSFPVHHSICSCACPWRPFWCRPGAPHPPARSRRLNCNGDRGRGGSSTHAREAACGLLHCQGVHQWVDLPGVCQQNGVEYRFHCAGDLQHALLLCSLPAVHSFPPTPHVLHRMESFKHASRVTTRMRPHCAPTWHPHSAWCVPLGRRRPRVRRRSLSAVRPCCRTLRGSVRWVGGWVARCELIKVVVTPGVAGVHAAVIGCTCIVVHAYTMGPDTMGG